KIAMFRGLGPRFFVPPAHSARRLRPCFGTRMDPLNLTRELVAFDSVSSRSNAAVTDFVENTLHQLAFTTERIEYIDARGLRKCNVIGKKGEGKGGLAYFGHTDVVPADDWFTDEHGPFTPTVKGDRLYGRGSCDMKGSVACMLAAAA